MAIGAARAGGLLLLALTWWAGCAHGSERTNNSTAARDQLDPKRLTIAMWDFSWLFCHYPGGAFEDYDRVTDELLQRRFNTVRIDAFPLVIERLISEGAETFTVPGDPFRNWGPSDKDREHHVVAELVDFMTITKAKGIFVILSSWGHGDRERYSDRKRFWTAWKTILDLLQERRLLDHVLYVDFDQEFPYFSPFEPELKRLSTQPSSSTADAASAMQEAGAGAGAWNQAQRRFVKEYFESTLGHFKQRYPQLRFTFSLTSFWQEVRSIRPAGLDVLELHIWIKGQLDEYTGFNGLTKNRNPANDYKAYMAGIREAMKHQDALRQHMKSQLEFARSWAAELRVPLTTTEAWGPWWHMDHPDLEWQWLADWCEYCMGLSSEYGFWGSTPWNYSHPYWRNWSNTEWYQKVNSRFLRE